MDKKILFVYAVLFISLGASVNARAENFMLPPTTKVQNAQCGQTLAGLDTPIVANIVAGASSYRFRVSYMVPDVGVSVQYVTSSLRTFKLTQLANHAYARTYTIEVAVLHGGVWQPYGPACTVSSPTPITSLQSAYCGLTVASAADPVYATAVPFAAGYRFKVTNLMDPTDVHILDRHVREFRLNLFNVSSGSTYLVQVAVKNLDGNYLPYGPLCSVTAPILFTKIQATYCGHTLGAFSDYIVADLVPGASGYRFRITNLSNLSDVQTLDRPVRTFSMNMLSNIQYNTPYKIEVSIRDAQNQYLPYGPYCNVFTPSLPFPKIQLSQCEMTCVTLAEMMFADEQPNATGYRFWVYNELISYSQIITRSGRNYNLGMLSGLQPNTTYTVKVAAKVDNVWTGFGKACTVTTPSSFPASRMAGQLIDSSFLPKLYPNPYSEHFSLDAHLQPEAEVSVKIYDMAGRLLDQKYVAGAELPSLALGQNLPTGVYSIAVKYNDEVHTLRAVKR